MDEVMDPDAAELVKAVTLWTGWGASTSPVRDDSVLVRAFGTEATTRLLPTVKLLYSDFYESDARARASDLADMARIAEEQFLNRHPGMAPEVGKAFSWCYTFDYR